MSCLELYAVTRQILLHAKQDVTGYKVIGMVAKPFAPVSEAQIACRLWLQSSIISISNLGAHLTAVRHLAPASETLIQSKSTDPTFDPCLGHFRIRQILSPDSLTQILLTSSLQLQLQDAQVKFGFQSTLHPQIKDMDVGKCGCAQLTNP